MDENILKYLEDVRMQRCRMDLYAPEIIKDVEKIIKEYEESCNLEYGEDSDTPHKS